jgi:hypothetical protein
MTTAPAREEMMATLNTLYSFGGGSEVDYRYQGGLIADANGGADGTVFELMNTGSGYTEEVLYRFYGGYPTDGDSPVAGLIADANGDLFGTTQLGGANNLGAAFELVNTGSGYTEKVLYTFGGGADGAYPRAGLIADANGDLFGTTAGAPSRTATARCLSS